MKRLDNIDILRAGAMTMVIAQHSGILPFGWTGVWLFYVISGFVISGSLHQEAELKIDFTRKYYAFLIRRAFRIIPAYFVYVAIALFIAYYGMGLVPRDWIFLVTFTFNWEMIYGFAPQTAFSPLGHLWTVSVEQQFYLLFPFIYILPKQHISIIISILLLVAIPVARYLFSVSLLTASGDDLWRAFAIYASSILQFDGFITGALLSMLKNNQRFERSHLLLKAISIMCFITYIFVYVFIIYSLLDARGLDAFRNILSGILYGQYREVFVYTVVVLIAGILVNIALRRTPFFASEALQAFIARVGRMSYSGYLYHALVLFTLGRLFPLSAESDIWDKIMRFGVALIVTIAVSRISYGIVEKPMMIIGSKLSEKILLNSKRLSYRINGTI